MRVFYFVSMLVCATPLMAAESTGSITGAADADAQIVITNVDTGEVIGIMGKCDGTYRAENLKPGRYKIQEQRPHLAAREIGVTAGKESHVNATFERPLTKDCAAHN